MTRAERTTIAAMAGVVLALHVVGFGLLFLAVVPAHLSLGGAGVFGAGLGLTAYTLGVRHAFDADHIAAIDGTTRALMARGQRPQSVGFFFSLGHSTVVFALALLLGVGVRAVAGPLRDDSSALHRITGLVGPAVSGTFLCVIAALNVAVLVGLLRTLRAVRRGESSSAALDQAAIAGGPMSRLLGRATRAVRRPWQMYPLGLLFGLGFDTATEVSLLFLAGGAAGVGLPWWAVMCLPILFAAGMSLFDTIDGSFMNFAYGWALSRPVRKLYYNLTVTALSIVVALGIGSIELLSVIPRHVGLTGGPWAIAAGIDLNVAGYAVVGLFAATWAIAIAAWRLGRVEERWEIADGG
ncbi:MAG: nickel/cobalt transporter (NiCoT) family protein [Solirubrobacteraceae bacterium]|jgi:high-affinity nickel-transport protein|nr:nickel/cobalt transporter (NiCoT) family protein [Solirubrobacteraceae bacterium]